MAETLSLKELKEQNAETNAAEETKEEEIVKDTTVTDDYVEEVEEVKAGEAEESESAEADDDKAELESWMQTDEATSDGEQSGFKPNPEAAKLRKKLRAKLDEKDDELEKLKAEIEGLKKGATAKPAQSESLPPRPKLADYDYDDEKFEQALDDWQDKRLDQKLRTRESMTSKEVQAKQQQDAYKKDVSSAVDAHYSRAEKLVESGAVSADLYAQADRSVRQLVDSVYEGQGDEVTDGLIKTLNSLGEGSEKVLYSLGVNTTRRDRFETLLRKDVFAATAYLGSLQTELNSPNKRKSSAPKPPPKIEGDSTSGHGSTLQKQYEKAKDLQTKINLKRQAKRDGVDTSKW